MTPSAQRRSLWLAVAWFTLFALVMLADAFEHFANHGSKDWNCIFGQAQAELVSLRDHGEFPLWNPWRAGGQPSLAQPVGMLLSPITPLVLLFGVVAGFKLALVPIFVVGCLGMWKYAGELGLRGAARYAPAVALFGSSIFPLYVSGGLPNWLITLASAPWMVWALRRSLDDVRYVLLLGALVACQLFAGAIDRFIMIPLVLGLDATWIAVQRRSLRSLVRLAMALAFGALLASLKMVPLLEVFVSYPREIAADTRAVPPAMLLRLLLDSTPPDLVRLDAAFVDVGDGNTLYWINAGAYVGVAVVALAALGSTRLRACWPIALNAFLFTWLSLGSSVSPSLWNALHHFPFFSSLRGPERQLLWVVFFGALLAGYGVQSLTHLLERAFARSAWADRAPHLSAAVSGVLVLAIAAHLVDANRGIVASAFTVRAPAGLSDGGWLHRPESAAPFRQTSYRLHPLMWRGPLWEAVVRNEGNLAGMVNIPMPVAALSSESERYKGEAWVTGRKGTAEVVARTANRVRVRARLEADGQLVLNQNYAPGWRASQGEVRSAKHRLAVRLPSGEHDVELVYRPTSVAVGMLGTTLALAVAAWTLARTHGRSRTGP